MSHVAITAPEIWFKSKRVIRTVLASFVVIVPIANASLPLLAEAFNAEGVPPEVYLAVNAAVAGVLVVLGIITRIMAIPAVNDLLTRVGAGSVPKAVAANGLTAPIGGAPLDGR